MQRCPCCNARLKEAVNCPRCKADLHEIAQVHQLAKFWYQKAIVYYLDNELKSCVDAITRSLQLQHTDSAFIFKTFATERLNQTMRFSMQGIMKVAQTHVADLISSAVSTFECLILKAKQYVLRVDNHEDTRQ